MKKIKNETGRSMVEMLGVLAIIGVLSVAGVVGFNAAMNRYRANEIIHVASILEVVARAANTGEGDCIKLSTSNLPYSLSGVEEIVVDATVSGAELRVQIQGPASDGAICNIIGSLKPDYECGVSVDDCED